MGLQVVDFREAMGSKERLFWNSTFEQLLLACPDEAAAASVFSRLEGLPALQALAASMAFYLQHSFAPWAARRASEAAEEKKGAADRVLTHLKVARKALNAASIAVLVGG